MRRGRAPFARAGVTGICVCAGLFSLVACGGQADLPAAGEAAVVAAEGPRTEADTTTSLLSLRIEGFVKAAGIT